MDLVCAKLKKRGMETSFLDKLIYLDKDRKKLIQEIDQKDFTRII